MNLLHGFDLSAYQGTTAPKANVDLIKATEGASYKSPKYAAQRASSRRNADHTGAYHFARPEESSYSDQAKFFLDTAQPERGESIWLDLEASRLSQAATNAWARGWGDYMAEHAPNISGLYMGAGYASSNTGKGLAGHFRLWWYPQYPLAYQAARLDPDHETRRAANRTSYTPERTPLARTTSSWPSTFSPWLPSGVKATGWSHPHGWQFTDNFRGLDASVFALTLDELAGKPTPAPNPAPTAQGGNAWTSLT